MRVEKFAVGLSSETTASVRRATSSVVSARLSTLPTVFADPEAARQTAAEVKSYVLSNLRALLLEFEGKCAENGIIVHWAKDADSANRQILDICRRVAPEGCTVAKAKSMATEEIHLNRHLIETGFEPIETDLGEFVIQLDDDLPSHIVAPIIHKNRKQIAETFKREGLGHYTIVPEELAMQARQHLRQKFREAKIGISGVNFGIASTGRLAIVENEGNNRLSTTVPKVHIAVMGIEKLIPRESDLALFLPLLAGSATGQKLTTYIHLIQGPAPDGPEEVHVVLLDNHRTKVLNGPYRDILRCIRCGACLNVCPVYRQSSGHAYGHVYGGPLGAVLAPALDGVAAYGDLAKASSLCGACEEVCPVKIPLPDMLLKLRNEAHQEGVASDNIPWKFFGRGASSHGAWKAGLKFLPMATGLPHSSKSSWAEKREVPRREGRTFRKWWHDRS